MKTWSSVKKYYSENKRDLDLVKPGVKALWEDKLDKNEVTRNINIRAGVIK